MVIMLLMVLAFLFHVSPQYLCNYQASLIDKVNRLESIEGPKIVLLSNSNLAFGINSEDIESAFGMPVVNMGLHGGLGNAFHEEMGKLNVCEGDIYIICHSSYSDVGGIEDPELAWITIEDHFKLWKMLRTEDIKPMVKAYPAYLKKCISLWLNDAGNMEEKGVYSRAAFNEYGDIEWKDKGQKYEFVEGSVVVPEISDNVVERINELDKYFSERGATLLIGGYPIGSGEYTPDAELFVEFQQQLEEKLNPPVISDFTDYFYEYKYFYNTNLHLNNEGKNLRTQQLIEDLQNYFIAGGEQK